MGPPCTSRTNWDCAGREAKIGFQRLPVRPRFSFDSDYVRRLVAGDPDTERHFTDYFGDLLTLKLRSRLRSAAQVEDARQETFVRVLTTLKQKRALATPESLGAFVNGVCNNVLLETYRGAGRHDQLDDNADGPETTAPSTDCFNATCRRFTAGRMVESRDGRETR